MNKAGKCTLKGIPELKAVVTIVNGMVKNCIYVNMYLVLSDGYLIHRIPEL